LRDRNGLSGSSRFYQRGEYKYECVSLIVALLHQMVVLCQVALLLERTSKFLISVTAVLRVLLRTVGAESEECVSFLKNAYFGWQK
jgi:hypothetical protein